MQDSFNDFAYLVGNNVKMSRNMEFPNMWHFDMNTVNSEIFARTLFSQNFAYAKFRENKPSRNGKITLSLFDIGKSCLNRETFTSIICLLKLFAIIKFSRKLPNLQ